jgi:hypothetical protein
MALATSKTRGFRIRRVEYALLALARALPASLLLAAALVAHPARADGGPRFADGGTRFGEPGTLAFGGDFGLGGEQGLDHGYATEVDLELDPALDVFVARRVSLGVGSTLSYSFARTSASSSLVSISPRVGYALPLGRLFVLWPRLSFDMAYADTGGEQHRILASTLFVPVDAFVLSHLAVGIGPGLTQQLRDSTSAGNVPVTTTVQLLVELAGWL